MSCVIWTNLSGGASSIVNIGSRTNAGSQFEDLSPKGHVGSGITAEKVQNTILFSLKLKKLYCKQDLRLIHYTRRFYQLRHHSHAQ